MFLYVRRRLIVIDVTVVVAVGVHGEGLIGGTVDIARHRYEARRHLSGSPVRRRGAADRRTSCRNAQ
jgi:hypothetical protein